MQVRVLSRSFLFHHLQSASAPNNTVLFPSLDPARVTVLGAAVGDAVVLGGGGAGVAGVARNALGKKLLSMKGEKFAKLLTISDNGFG